MGKKALKLKSGAGDTGYGGWDGVNEGRLDPELGYPHCRGLSTGCHPWGSPIYVPRVWTLFL